MKKQSRRTFLKYSGAVATLAMVAGSAKAATLAERPSLRIAIPTLPTEFEPVHPQSLSVGSYRVLQSIFDTLLTINPETYAIENGLVESVTPVTPTEFDLTFRKDVKFHDGSLMTIEDVLFSFGDVRLLGEKAPGLSAKKAYLSSLSKVEKLDQWTARFHLSGPDPVFIKRMSAWGSQIVSQKAYEAAPSFDAWAANPIGTGPYRLNEYRSGDVVELIAHDEYWGGLPPFSSIRFKQVPELLARVLGLQSGEYDIIADVTPDQFDVIKNDLKLEVVGGAPAGYQMILFDVNGTPAIQSRELRQALNLAVDRHVIVDALWGGKVTVPNGHQLPAYGDLYDADRPALRYDPDEARRLVEASGYNGEEIPYRMVPTYYPNELATGQILVEFWRAVGINVRLEMVEDIAQVYKEHAGHILDGTNIMSFPDPLSTSWRKYGSGSAVQLAQKWWSNDEYNELGKILEQSLDVPERKKAFQRMLDIIENEDPPSVLLHTTAYFYGKRKDVDWAPHFLPNMIFA